ncbi:MAG: hypothetical protein LBN19_01395 [Endomicrobium sp.]|jgi:hypothetical protein|nr:hypothetical protein [Endomicrobium sp.]
MACGCKAKKAAPEKKTVKKAVSKQRKMNPLWRLLNGNFDFSKPLSKY